MPCATHGLLILCRSQCELWNQMTWTFALRTAANQKAPAPGSVLFIYAMTLLVFWHALIRALRTGSTAACLIIC
eukprot:5928875-Amphidinium_carterae.1